MINRRKAAYAKDIQDRIVSSEKIAHVTFHLVKDVEEFTPGMPEGYFVYSESDNRGVEQIASDDYGFCPMTYAEATQVLRESIQKFEDLLEKKRSAMPTAKQVYYLFCRKIPIPIDLTWGEASDIIDKHINQEKQAQRQRQAERFDGFTVGQSLTFQFFNRRTQAKWQETGTITKLTGNNRSARYMYVKGNDGKTIRWPLSGLPKIIREETAQ